MDVELVDLGASRRDPETNALLVQSRVGTEDNTEDFGESPMMQGLGLTAVPWPADETGAAQAVCVSVPGIDGAVIGARDTRTANVTEALGPGDTALHGTGPDHKSQVRCQKRMVSIVTVDADDFNCMIIVDGLKKKIQIAGFGHVFEMSEQNGIVLAEEGGAALILKGGTAQLKGSSVALGEGAKLPVHAGPGAGSTSVPSLSVLVPAG